MPDRWLIGVQNTQNPYTRSIVLDKGTPFYTVFVDCLSLGMNVLGVSCKIVGEKLSIEKMLKVIT